MRPGRSARVERKEAQMGILIGLVVFVLDVIAIIDALKGPLSGGKKALWIIVIIVFPILGMILYFLLGRQ
jgi:hypothetical protein